MNMLVKQTKLFDYSSQQTDSCPFLQKNGFYTNIQQLPSFILGYADLSVVQFYQSDCEPIPLEGYKLSRSAQGITTRFPHTNSQVELNSDGMYSFLQVPIYIETADLVTAIQDLEHYSAFLKEFDQLSQLSFIETDELSVLESYKRKRLLLSGEYGQRELLCPTHQENAQPIQEKLFLKRELYYFANYIYAGMINFYPQFEINSYEDFHEKYGKYVYSFTITKDGKTFPLLWPDYLYHQPENHLEFGITLDKEHPRYQFFSDWYEGEEIKLTILATGFQDLILTTRLKKPETIISHLSKKVYQSNEELELIADGGLIEDIINNRTKLMIQTPNQETFDSQDIITTHTANSILIPFDQFQQDGRYQIQLMGKTYGEHLFFCRYEQKEIEK